MGNVFRVRPVRVKRANGQVLTPDMEITVTTQSYTSDPFYNGAKEIQEQYMRMYQFDYKKSIDNLCQPSPRYNAFCLSASNLSSIVSTRNPLSTAFTL